MWLEESGGTDLTGGTSGLRAAWPHSTRGGAHHPNTMGGYLMPYKRHARGYEVPWCLGVALLPQE
jgi:hypothetical protein